MLMRSSTTTTNPLDALRIDPTELDTPTAMLARRRGLLGAKRSAYTTTTRLARWARPLSVAVVLTSGLHLWSTLAAIAPADVTPLDLPDVVYHLSALALVATVDLSIIFLSASGNAAAFAGYHERSKALPLLYLITGLLNGAYLVSHMPNIPVGLQAAALPALAVIFAVLLAILVPVVLVAIERAHHVLHAAQLALGVEVATLHGLIEEGATQRLPAVPTEPDALPEVPETAPETAPETETVTDGVPDRNVPKTYTCRKCGRGGLTFPELGRHARSCNPMAVAAD